MDIEKNKPQTNEVKQLTIEEIENTKLTDKFHKEIEDLRKEINLK
jgi:hypothetical protein